MGKRIYAFDLVKVVAIALVLNSHLNPVYPIEALATGGALGNGLFFAVSGYLSVRIRDKFGPWIVKKYLRLFISVWLIVLCNYFIGFIDFNNVGVIFREAIWPTSYWFAGALVLFYPLYYLAVIRDFKFEIVSIISLILYFGLYFTLVPRDIWSVETTGLDTALSLFKLIYYFYIMYLGSLISRNKLVVSNRIFGVFGILFGVASLYIVKFIINRYPELMWLQFLNQFSVILFSISTINFVKLNYKRIDSYISASKIREKGIYYLSKMSFEIYLAQRVIIRSFATISVFPINFLIVVSFSILFGYVLNLASNYLYRFISDLFLVKKGEY